MPERYPQISGEIRPLLTPAPKAGDIDQWSAARNGPTPADHGRGDINLHHDPDLEPIPRSFFLIPLFYNWIPGIQTTLVTVMHFPLKVSRQESLTLTNKRMYSFQVPTHIPT